MATINGTNNADTLYGTASADTINGLGGNDTLKGGGGADRIDGGAGIDTAFYSDFTAAVTVNLQNGTGFGGSAQGDTLVGVENLWGSSHNDQLIGNAFTNVLTGGNGNDLLKGGGGADDVLNGDAGNDTLKGGGGSGTLNGGSGNDTADFTGHGVGMTVSLTQGISAAFISWPNDIPDWAHVMHRLSGIENVTGTLEQDFLIGDGVANVLNGLDGPDILDGRGGADVMIGGLGDEDYFVDNAGDIVREYAGEGSDQVFASTSYTLAAGTEIEWLAAEDFAGAINLTGNEFANTVVGNGADNIIDGGGGADLLHGKGGNDTYIVDNTGDNPNEWDGEGFDTVITSATFTLNFLAEIELVQTSNAAGTAAIDLRGNLYTQTLIGNAGNNTLRAGEGTDTLIGNDGNDVLRGEEHADTLDGGAGFDIASYEGSAAVQVNLALGQATGNHAQGDVLVGIEGLIGSAQGDQLTGDAIGNVLNGGGGPDVLTGGDGTDLFQFNVGQANGDTVVDFAGNGPAPGDTMQFIGYGVGATFTQIDGTHWQVNYNADTQHEVITILNGAVFDPSDILFV